MNAPFFIVGLPRSRTAWLANLLTYGPAFCLHDGLRDCETPDELATRLAATGALWPGDADPALPLFFRKIHARWPGARYVFIHRDPRQAREAYVRATKSLVTRKEAIKHFDALEPALLAMKTALRGQHVLEIEFERLEFRESARAIWQHCVPGTEFNAARWELLHRLRVEVIPAKAADVDRARVDRLARAAEDLDATPLPIKGSDVLPGKREYLALLTEMCGGNQGALAWLVSWLNLTLTWDHIQDNDPIDKGIANWAFEQALLEWPVNEFWRAHGPALRTTIAATIEAWRDSDQPGGDRFKAWDVYTAVPVAVALILGGRDHVARFSPRLHELIRRGYNDHIAKEAAQ